MPSQHFFVEGRYLGARQVPPFRKIPGMEIRPYDSHVFYCIRCGEIWGRMLIEGATYTQLTQRPCAKHGDGHLSEDWLPAEYNRTRFEEDWPPDAVKYEFECQIIRALKEAR